jgi:hypothetical protein
MKILGLELQYFVCAIIFGVIIAGGITFLTTPHPVIVPVQVITPVPTPPPVVITQAAQQLVISDEFGTMNAELTKMMSDMIPMMLIATTLAAIVGILGSVMRTGRE